MWAYGVKQVTLFVATARDAGFRVECPRNAKRAPKLVLLCILIVNQTYAGDLIKRVLVFYCIRREGLA